MVMSTPILADAEALLSTVLIDSIQIYDVGDPVTVGYEVTRPLTAVGQPVPSLVQATNLANAVESRTETIYSVKVARGTDIQAGQAVEVLECEQEPDLVGKRLLLDKVSQNGAAIIRKAVASDFQVVNQEGKAGI